MYCCWEGTIQEFLLLSKEDWLISMQSNHKTLLNEGASKAQLGAWSDCFDVLNKQLQYIEPQYRSEHLIFEYLLPREGGRRPDVVLLIGNHVIILEFKQKYTYNEADLDQAIGYARDLREYHLESRESVVVAYLVATKRSRGVKHISGISSLAPIEIAETINSLPIEERKICRKKWLVSDYVPLPSLIKAAIDIFENKDMPHIRRAYSYGIPKAISEIENIIATAKQNKEHHIIFITGVPGAGKTLLGLQTVYEMNKRNEPAIFLSGNGPLVKVLADVLSTNTLIKGLHTFTDTYADNSRNIPREHVLIFDEAQRAWDANYKRNKHKGSEPEQLIRIANREKAWTVLILLIGEGQEIYLGEEAGVAQWDSALNASPTMWQLHLPDKLLSTMHSSNISVNSLFNLDRTLRSHLASNVILWIEFLLSGDFESANNQYQKIRQEGFSIYLTDNIEKVKAYCRIAYCNMPNKRYGLLASSKDNDLQNFGILNGFNDTQKVQYARWYNDTPEKPLSCCQLNTVITEFGCQGLELDMPIVCWGDDLLWKNNKWESREDKKANDSHKLRLNSYRVLLSRGRDGFIIFLPPSHKYDSTRAALFASGVKRLTMSDY